MGLIIFIWLRVIFVAHCRQRGALLFGDRFMGGFYACTNFDNSTLFAFRIVEDSVFPPLTSIIKKKLTEHLQEWLFQIDTVKSLFLAIIIKRCALT